MSLNFFSSVLLFSCLFIYLKSAKVYKIEKPILTAIYEDDNNFSFLIGEINEESKGFKEFDIEIYEKENEIKTVNCLVPKNSKDAVCIIYKTNPKEKIDIKKYKIVRGQYYVKNSNEKIDISKPMIVDKQQQRPAKKDIKGSSVTNKINEKDMEKIIDFLKKNEKYNDDLLKKLVQNIGNKLNLGQLKKLFTGIKKSLPQQKIKELAVSLNNRISEKDIQRLLSLKKEQANISLNTKKYLYELLSKYDFARNKMENLRTTEKNRNYNKKLLNEIKHMKDIAKTSKIYNNLNEKIGKSAEKSYKKIEKIK